MRTSLWPMALLASSIVAAPLAGDVVPYQKRQTALPGQPGAPPIPKQFSLPALLKNPSLLKEIQPLLDSQNKSGSAGRFMGTPEAFPALTAMAKLMGASKKSPGRFMEFNLETMFTEYGITSDPPEAKSVSRKQISESKTSTPKAKAVKIRYGPYKVPSVKTKNLEGQYGMLADFPHVNFDKPCDGDCTIIGMKQGLEYPNGTNANINSGLWLHHSVIFAIGKGRSDPSCTQFDISIPHISVNTTAFESERIFSNGNERTDAIFPDMGASDVGYKIRSADRLAALLEVMNENPRVEVVYFTMIWDILEGHPLPHEPVAIWHDLRVCGTSEVNPPDGQDKFTLESTLVAPITAEILTSIGHVHDGGTLTTLHVNGKELACQSDAKYGTTPDYISSSMGDMPGMNNHVAEGTMKHVSYMGACTAANGLNIKKMEKGQKWVLKAEYDFKTWPGMKGEDGKWDEVMGIHVMYVKKPKAP